MEHLKVTRRECSQDAGSITSPGSKGPELYAKPPLILRDQVGISLLTTIVSTKCASYCHFLTHPGSEIPAKAGDLEPMKVLLQLGFRRCVGLQNLILVKKPKVGITVVMSNLHMK